MRTVASRWANTGRELERQHDFNHATARTRARPQALISLAGVAVAKEWTKVRIGVEGAYPPFSSIAPDGKLVGFDIDIANGAVRAR